MQAGHMITTTLQHHCRKCGRTNSVKNGHNRSGSQQYRCKECRAIGVLTPKSPRYSDVRREEVLRTYQEQPSMLGISRIFEVLFFHLFFWVVVEIR